MDVGNSVRKSIDDWEDGELDAAMLHACNAVDGTAAKGSPTGKSSNARFTGLLRDNYPILGPMGAPGIDLINTRFPVKVDRPKAPGGRPDLADVIYGIHRCHHGHGQALPAGFELLQDVGSDLTRFEAEYGLVRLSDRIIFGLLAVAVMSPANIGQTIPSEYRFCFDGDVFPIQRWWGRATEFSTILAKKVVPLVTLDFDDWMDITD